MRNRVASTGQSKGEKRCNHKARKGELRLKNARDAFASVVPDPGETLATLRSYLVKNPMNVSFDGLLRNIQLIRDFFVGQAPIDQWN